MKFYRRLHRPNDVRTEYQFRALRLLNQGRTHRQGIRTLSKIEQEQGEDDETEDGAEREAADGAAHLLREQLQTRRHHEGAADHDDGTSSKSHQGVVPEQAVQGQEDCYEAAAKDEEQRRRRKKGTLRATKAAGWLVWCLFENK